MALMYFARASGWYNDALLRLHLDEAELRRAAPAGRCSVSCARAITNASTERSTCSVIARRAASQSCRSSASTSSRVLVGRPCRCASTATRVPLAIRYILPRTLSSSRRICSRPAISAMRMWKRLVDAVHVLLAATLALEDGAQLADVRRRGGLAQPADDELLERHAQQADLADRRLVELDQAVAALRHDLDHAVAKQVEQRLAHRRARHAERLGERAFGEQPAARDLAVADGAPDGVVALLGQAFRSERGWGAMTSPMRQPGRRRCRPTGCGLYGTFYRPARGGEGGGWISA